MKEIEGMLQVGNDRIALVVARFNSFVTERLVEGAVDCIVRHGGKKEDLILVRVPGSWEIPLAVKKLVDSGKIQGVIALGAVIRGDTPHFDYVSAEVSKGIASVSLDSGIPVSFGVLTTDSTEQAVERAGVKAGNKGWDAAMTLLEILSLNRQIEVSLIGLK